MSFAWLLETLASSDSDIPTNTKKINYIKLIVPNTVAVVYKSEKIVSFMKY